MNTLSRVLLRQLFGKLGRRRVQGWRLFYRLRVEVLLHTRKAIERISSVARVRVWVDQEAFPRICKLLRRARHTVIIQMFIWKDDALGRRMAAEIVRLADRGVQIDITKEAAGDVFELHKDFLATRSAHDPMWQRFWSHPRIRITYSHNNDHAKVYIIDDRILLLTGMNISEDEYLKWHDYLVELRDHSSVSHYLTDGEVRSSDRGACLVMNREGRREIRPVLMRLLRSARKSVVAEHCYISDPQVLAELVRLTHGGVRVTLIAPEKLDVHYHATWQSIAQLVRLSDPSRLRIFVYPGFLHAKIILVDRRQVFVGSANLMRSSLDEMGEVNVLFDDTAEGALFKIREILRRDILKSRPLTGPLRLSWLSRWLAWLKL
ncbi:MAG: cardiolipin synthase [Candidatus Peregrinibacteria bacterium Greene0416_19]|nr:MAG: cardiolipin synthase [Candidatus Peregrinibacteria bacterium Greene0416_19]